MRARALAWCARILSSGDTRPRAVALLAKSRELALTSEASLAEAFLVAGTNKSAALVSLAAQKTPAALAAALRIWINSDGPKVAFDWATILVLMKIVLTQMENTRICSPPCIPRIGMFYSGVPGR